MVYKFHKIYFSASEMKRLVRYFRKYAVDFNVDDLEGWLLHCSDPDDILINSDYFPDWLVNFAGRRLNYGPYGR